MRQDSGMEFMYKLKLCARIAEQVIEDCFGADC